MSFAKPLLLILLYVVLNQSCDNFKQSSDFAEDEMTVALRNCDTFFINFQKGHDLRSKTVTFGSLRAKKIWFSKGEGSVPGPPKNTTFWLLLDTLTHEDLQGLHF